ncbi:MAG: Tim44 domain-containing protein [Janthinobacterium lividum]
MKKILMGLMVAVMAVTIGMSSVEAKRMGGGGSFGKQSQSVSRQTPAQSTQAPAAAAARPPAAAAAAPAASPWKGMLGGALLGLGLGALFSSMGMGGAMASMLSSILMIGLLAAAGMFIYRLWKKRSAGNESGSLRPAFSTPVPLDERMQPKAFNGEDRSPMALHSASPAPAAAGVATSVSAHAGNAVAAQPWGIPADFDTNGFLRQSKGYFIRLQAAWDKADINDIREFTTPEMFAEMRMQLQERGAVANHTDVVAIDAELLGIETQGDEYLASVKFSGQIRETADAAAAPFAEVWNLSKPVSGAGGWTLAGIQQLS